MGIHLNIPQNDREVLERDISLSHNSKLERIINKWIHSETTDVTWRVIITSLKALDRKDLIKEVIRYLENPATYEKYILKDDFCFCPDI